MKRTRKGEYQLRLLAEERDLLRTLPAQLRQLLETDVADPALKRLFPIAYLDDPAYEAEYQKYMHEELLASHVRALETMERTVDAAVLSEDQMAAWLSALNELRLVLGTRLDVSEDMDAPDPDDPRAPAFALYLYLGWLQDEVVSAMAEGL